MSIEGEADPLDEMIERLNAGDISAAERAFVKYEPYLRMAVRRRLTGPLRAKLDSTDVVQSVWVDILAGFRDTDWRFTDGTHLRAFLVRLAYNRLIDRSRKYHRAIERERPLDQSYPDDLPRTQQPRPSEVFAGEELWERMLASCPAAHRDLLRLRRQGLTLAEIAAKTGLHPGSVRRILKDIARRVKPVQSVAP
jgi:RNA polymerase sigma factor (sigma-70 family)